MPGGVKMYYKKMGDKSTKMWELKTGGTRIYLNTKCNGDNGCGDDDWI